MIKKYTIKVVCEYYETKIATSKEEAIELCIDDPEYTISDLQNFEYTVENEFEFEEEEE